MKCFEFVAGVCWLAVCHYNDIPAAAGYTTDTNTISRTQKIKSIQQRRFFTYLRVLLQSRMLAYRHPTTQLIKNIYFLVFLPNI